MRKKEEVARKLQLIERIHQTSWNREKPPREDTTKYKTQLMQQ